MADAEAVQMLGICQIVDRCSPVSGAGYTNSASVSALPHGHVVVMTVGRSGWRLAGAWRLATRMVFQIAPGIRPCPRLGIARLNQRIGRG